MKILYQSLCICILCCYTHILHAQLPKPPSNTQSPNVASLGLFGEMPVSLANGLVNIDMPLYELKDGDIKVPVTLSYHASGVRPDMHPGWVGLGWALNAGGSISRIVKDVPDDYNNPNYGSYGEQIGFFWNHSVLAVANWNQVAYMQSIARNDAMLKDTEPDEYSFSYPGGSGKFYLDAQGNWKVKCDKPVKVKFNNQFLSVPFTAPQWTRMNDYGNSQSFGGFTIIDENGNQYVYGGSTSAIEYAIGFFSQEVDEWIAQAWYLTKIIHADGYEVNLTYERDNLINQMYVSISMDRGTRTSNNGSIFNPQPSCSSSNYGSSEYYYFEGKLLAPAYLKSIEGANSRVFFDRSTSTELRYADAAYLYKYSNFMQNHVGYGSFLPVLETDVYFPNCLDRLQWKKLDKIRVEDMQGTTRRSFNFSYNNVATERLMLRSVEEAGVNGDVKPPYKFYYDNSRALPPYLSCRIDHWGFYNGTYADISNQSTFLDTYYGYREPNASFLLAGTLNKIVYPTGGVTEFTFEPHQYNRRLSVNRTDGIDPYFNAKTLAGGLRIRKISSYDVMNPATKIEKEYFYIDGYTNTVNPDNQSSSGVLGGQVKYYFDDYRTRAFNDNGVVYSKAAFSSQSVLPASENSLGCHIGYSEVTEKLPDGSYTRYFFTNYDGHLDEPVPCLQLTRTSYEPATSLAAERGLLLREEHYDNNNTLLRKREVEYDTLNKSNEYARAMSARYFNVCNNTAVSVEEGVAYRLYTYSYVPKTEIITEYDETGQRPLTTRKDMAYHPQYRQLKEEAIEDSKGQLTKTYYRYPYDVLGYTPSGVVDISQPAAYMMSRNIVGWPVEVINTKTISNAERVVGSKAVTYKGFSGKLKPWLEYSFAATTPLARTSYTNYTVTGNNGADIISKDSRLTGTAEYQAFDERGNVAGYAAANDNPKSFIWDYNKNNVVAEVDNATIGQVAYSSFETSDLGGWSADEGGVYLLNNGNVTGSRSYSGQLRKTVSAGNYIVTLWAPTGGTQSVNGQAGTVLATNGNKVLKQWQLSNPGTVVAAADNMDDLRLYPEGAQMTTYTYDPLIGMTSKSDLNNQIAYYEYDGLGRLRYERDGEKNLRRKILYNYRDEPAVTYYSRYTGMDFIKECFGKGSLVQYAVPAGAYTSVISQYDADAQAQHDLFTNGQQYANVNGTCDDLPDTLYYVTIANLPITLSFENTYTHKVYNFSITQQSTTMVPFGMLPKGWYNVTVNVPGTATHVLGVGSNWKIAEGPISFTNIRMQNTLDNLVVINQ